jgi:hypothetical protein
VRVRRDLEVGRKLDPHDDGVASLARITH